ncbi:MAG TPA: PEP-CTERM sorting domain-containing protein [Myxococcales bacterium]|nr:PEP-CTERM sorting domain-containing protein [Myxococcales bacterium]
MFKVLIRSVYIVLALCCLAGSVANAQVDFVTFESGAVTPVALSPDGNTLFVTNIPDAHLEVFDVSAGGAPVPVASIPVGLEPVAVVAVSNDEAWVVNHLSDSVSIVSVSAGRVIRTLLVGDEPRGIAVADPPGATGPRVFVSTAHRGQHRTDSSIAGAPGSGDPQLTTPGVSRNDVWVFDAVDPGSAFGGVPLKIMSFFSDTPRAVVASPDGSAVYVAALHSGNQTTVVSEGTVCDGFGPAPCAGDGVTVPGGLPGGNMPGGIPGPSDNSAGVQAPEVGLIVKWNAAASQFQDELNRNWNNGVRFNLPDTDVFAIDTESLVETASHSHVGTTLFNMAVNPQSGALYVSNTEAFNQVRFEGPGTHGGTTVQGHLAESRITVIGTPNLSSDATLGARHLNKHIDFSVLASDPAFDLTAAGKSLATPLEMAIHHDAALGSTTLYVAAFGSAKIGIFDTAALEADSFTPDQNQQIGLSAGGPCGIALSSDGSTLYVMTRFDNGISVVDTASRSETHHLTLHNPEPSNVVAGRPFLYDALATSANGAESCSSCHTFGDMDQLAWDLGNPDEEVTSNPMPINFSDLFPGFSAAGLDIDALNGGAAPDEFHSMKGPMTTQTLKSLVHSGAMHWRGDRSNGAFGIDATDTTLSFNNFIVAFSGLVGRSSDLTPVQMQAFTDFALAMTLGPNPVRNLDNSLTASQQGGFDFYFGPRRSDGLVDNPQLDVLLGIPNVEEGFTCDGCHELNPGLGRFGTSTNGTFENETQIFKIAHLRNMYAKVGMFGAADNGFESPGGDHSHQGDQIRGFGFLHDGSEDTLERFFRATVFNDLFNNGTGFDNPGAQIPQMVDFMLAFDSDLPPIAGQQVTLSLTSGADTDARLALLIDRAGTPFTSKILGGVVTECDLIAKGTVAGVPMGWLYTGGVPGSATFDASDGTSTTEAALRILAQSTDLTFTCLPAGSGIRMALNRDRDLFLDGPDNCPALANNDQIDTDMDGLGDPCDPTPVPEPGAGALLIAGIGGLVGMRRRRSRLLA